MKNIFYGLLILFISTSLLANEVDQENFDRLFTSHNERQKLDKLRQQGLLYKKSISDVIDENKPLVRNRELKVSGIVVRADGKAQVWLSGQPLYSSLKELNTSKETSANLRVPLAGKSISLKPGQVLSNGKAKEAYYFVTQSSVSSQTLLEPQAQSIVSSSIASVSSSSVSSPGSGHAKTKAP
jgi:hypothetical protein